MTRLRPPSPDRSRAPRVRPSAVRGALAAALLALAACGGGADGAISRERFVQVSVELRKIPPMGAGADSARRITLRKAGVTEADLKRFVEVHGRRDASYLAATWREIADRLDADTSAAASASAAATPVLTIDSAGNTNVAPPPPPLPGEIPSPAERERMLIEGREP